MKCFSEIGLAETPGNPETIQFFTWGEIMRFSINILFSCQIWQLG